MEGNTIMLIECAANIILIIILLDILIGVALGIIDLIIGSSAMISVCGTGSLGGAVGG